MTTTMQTATKPAVRGNPWRPSFHGVGLVARIDLQRRRPSTKGWIFYGLTFAFILALGILVAVLTRDTEKSSVPLELVLMLVLGVGFLIGPSLSATSINGDSGEGVLAPMQMSRLTAGDLALGKLLASWAVSVAALVTMTPFLVYAFSRSGWHFMELLAVLGIILFMVLMATAIGLAWSAIAARAVASVSLAHLTTGVLVLGTLLMFAFTMPLVTETVEVTSKQRDDRTVTEEQFNDPDFDYNALPCIDVTDTWDVVHGERTAWLLLLNPMVVVAEASPIVDPVTYREDGRAAPGFLAAIHASVAGQRLGPETPVGYDGCATEYVEDNSWEERETAKAHMPPAPWLGLGLSAALLVGSMVIVVNRLRVPYKKLRSGTRVA